MGKTTAILAVIAAVMMAFIVFYERGTTSTRQLDERKGHVFPAFVRDRVSRIEVKRQGVKVVLSRGRKPEEIELSAWVVERPFSAQADSPIVDTALGALEWLDAKRTFERIGDEDRKRFGFEKPTLRGWYTLDKKPMAFVVGHPDPLGQGYYLQTDDRTRAFVVGKEFVEAFNREPSDFHTKELHESFSATMTGSVTLRDEEGERVVETRDQQWWLTKPLLAIASQAVVDEMIKGLDELKATRFVAETAGDLAKYGLETPVFEVVVRGRVKTEGKPGILFDLRVGTQCGERQGESYVATGRPGAVACVADEGLSKLRKAASGLRDKRLLTLEDDAIKSVVIQQAERRLEFKRTESSWSYQATLDGKLVASGQADAAAVSEWFKALKAIKTDTFFSADPAALRAKGLDSPRIVLTFEKTDPSKKSVISVGARENYQVYIKRGDEPAIGVFAGTVYALLSPMYFRFRNLQLLDESESELYQLEATRGLAVERVIKQSDHWRVEQPLQVEADKTGMSEIARLFSNLKASRFVADEANDAHGLDKPVAILTARYRGADERSTGSKNAKPGASNQATHERSFTLKLGGSTEGGCYAQLGQDPVVFVAASELVDLIVQPFANRSFLATPLEQIERIKLVKRGLPPIEIQRQGQEEWVATGKSINRSRAKRIAETVASLRASSVSGYGHGSFLEGMNYARVRVFVVRKPEAPAPNSYEITIGNDAPRSSSGARVYVRRTGTPVGYTIPMKVAREFLD